MYVNVCYESTCYLAVICQQPLKLSIYTSCRNDNNLGQKFIFLYHVSIYATNQYLRIFVLGVLKDKMDQQLICIKKSDAWYLSIRGFCSNKRMCPYLQGKCLFRTMISMWVIPHGHSFRKKDETCPLRKACKK